MGQSLNPMQTHEVVPDDVKRSIPPIDYEPCPLEEREMDREVCEDCGSAFGWFCASTNCDRCGRMLCTRCCPSRYLLHNRPGCQVCTQAAYRQRRSEMLSAHYTKAGVQRPMKTAGQTIPVRPKASEAAGCVPAMGVLASTSPLPRHDSAVAANGSVPAS